MPCDTGRNKVEDVLNGLGTYGDVNNFVMYKQTVTSDNYEVNDTHTNTDKTMLSADDTLKQGISYWIITDENRTVTIDKTLSGLSPTSLSNASGDNISDPDFTQVHKYTLPDCDTSHGGDYKKFMAGNPFPYAFLIKDLYFGHNDNYNSMENNNSNDPYINATFYKHDSSETGPSNGYTAVSAGTPGFDNYGIKAMEGFFIKINKVDNNTDANNFAYPLMMKNGN